jgi:hypothetical protein
MASLYGSIGKERTLAAAANGTDQLKDYISKVAAHVPSEVISIFVVGKAITTEQNILGIWAVVCWVIALVMRWFGTKGDGRVLNVILTFLAFPIWVMVMGGTILGFAFSPQISALIALAFAVVAGFLYNNIK